MDFAKRVVRIRNRRKGGMVEVDTSAPPEVVASEHIVLKADEEEGRIGAPRASSLYQACMRMHVIGTKEETTKKSRISFKDKLIFGIGNAVHHWVQNDPTMFGDRRVGWWRCLACGTVAYFGTPPKVKCKQCGALPSAFTYWEHTLHYETDELVVTGHTDLFMLREPGDTCKVVEIKTISGDVFPTLKAPLIEHVWQATTYMWGCSNDLNIPIQIDDSLSYVFYVAKKNPSHSLPVKMFPVEKDPRLLSRVKTKLRSYKTGLKDYPKNLPMVLQPCADSNFGHYKARSCPTLKHCRRLHGRKL